MTYGNIVKERRLALKLTQRQLSKMTGVSNTYISEIESNNKLPSTKTANRLHSVLDVKIPEPVSVVNSEDTRKHNHYFIDVRGLDYIDPYMIAYLYNIDDPSGATQHALKKLLVPGKRGHKDVDTDLSNVIDTSNRLLEIKQQLAERDFKPEEFMSQYEVGDLWLLKGTTECFMTLEVSHDRIYLEPLKGNKEVFPIYFDNLHKHYLKVDSRVGS